MSSVGLIFLLSFVIGSQSANAGGMSTGGGSAVVCRNSQNQIQSAVLLDLYEAQNRFSLALANSSGSFQQDYLQAARYVDQQLGLNSSEQMIRATSNAEIYQFDRLTRFTQPGERLPLLADLGEILTPPVGCKLEQLAIFYDNEKYIHIDQEIYQALDSLNKAALISHELDYSGSRIVGETTSEVTRNFVAHRYSVTPRPLPQAGVPANATLCSANQMSFYLYKNQKEKSLNLQFDILMNRRLLTKSFVQIKGIKWKTKQMSVPESLVIVEEPEVNLDVQLPLQSMQRMNLEVRIRYKTGFPIMITLYQHGKQIQQTLLRSCL